MTQRNPGRLAIHRRSDEIEFLQHRLRVLSAAEESSRTQAQQDAPSENRDPPGIVAEEAEHRREVLARERDLADELLHTRQIEPLGEALQRRLAMAERVCRDLIPRTERSSQGSGSAGDQKPREDSGHAQDPIRGAHRSDTYRVAEVECQALMEMLNEWWAWLRDS
jgi:hypothetical protein